jgi:hypothetical protein
MIKFQDLGNVVVLYLLYTPDFKNDETCVVCVCRHWVKVCEDSGQPFPVPEMVLVVMLLCFGTPCLLFGFKVPYGVTALIIFQVRNVHACK